MVFGERLRAQRKKNNLSAEALAKNCNLSRSYITLIENNKRPPGKKIISKIAQALTIKPTIVLDWYLEDVREKMQKDLNIK